MQNEDGDYAKAFQCLLLNITETLDPLLKKNPVGIITWSLSSEEQITPGFKQKWSSRSIEISSVEELKNLEIEYEREFLKLSVPSSNPLSRLSYWIPEYVPYYNNGKEPSIDRLLIIYLLINTVSLWIEALKSTSIKKDIFDKLARVRTDSFFLVIGEESEEDPKEDYHELTATRTFLRRILLELGEALKSQREVRAKGAEKATKSKQEKQFYILDRYMKENGGRLPTPKQLMLWAQTHIKNVDLPTTTQTYKRWIENYKNRRQ